MDIDPQKILAAPALAGMAGAVVALRFAPGTSWAERITNVVSGFACAMFAAPALAEGFKLISVPMISALSFFTGMFGMSVAAALLQGVRDLKVADIVTGWISKK